MLVAFFATNSGNSGTNSFFGFMADAGISNQLIRNWRVRALKCDLGTLDVATRPKQYTCRM